MPEKIQIPKPLAAYLALKKPLGQSAIAALKKWAHLHLPGVEARLAMPMPAAVAAATTQRPAPHSDVSLTAGIDLWIAPDSYPRPEIVDIYAELSWQAPPGTTVTLEVQHLGANGTISRDWEVLLDNLPPTGFRVWDPPLLSGGGYGYRGCFRACTDTGTVSRVACRSANQ